MPTAVEGRDMKRLSVRRFLVFAARSRPTGECCFSGIRGWSRVGLYYDGFLTTQSYAKGMFEFGAIGFAVGSLYTAYVVIRSKH